MTTHRTGLHKEISTIFDGVPIPKHTGARPPDATPAPGRTSPVAPPKPPAQLPRTPSAPKPQTSAPAPPLPQKPTEQVPPKPVAPKQPKADILSKTWEQIKNKFFVPEPGGSSAKQKAMTVLIPVLFIVMIFVFMRAFSTPSRSAAGSESSGATNATAASGTDIDWQIPEPYPTTLRDPMQLGYGTTTQVGTDKLIVKGILYSSDNPAAIIGVQILREGDKISDTTIVKINKDSVIFELNGKKWSQKVER